MSESVFSKVYSYREKENKNSKETFLTEIFAHCLYADKKLLNNFFKQLKIETDAEVIIKTQSSYEFGRPDIEINIPATNTCILIECKIEHFERQDQLDDYKKILEGKNVSQRHLVYLTKYYDFRENNNKLIYLHLLKWFDIYQIIGKDNSEISQQLKSYLKDENMEESKKFNYNDLAVLQSTAGTIRKMNEVIDGVKEYYEKKIGLFSKESSRSTKLKEEWYAATHSVGRGPNFKFEIEIGFMWFWGDDEIYIGIRIWLPKAVKYKLTKTYLSMFKTYLKDWEIEEDYDNCYVIGRYKTVAEFIIDEEDQIPAMVQFLRDCTDNLEALKKADSKIFKY